MTMVVDVTDYRHKKFDAHRLRAVSSREEEPAWSSSPSLGVVSLYTAFSPDSSSLIGCEALESRKRRRLPRDTSTPLLKRIKLEAISFELDSESSYSIQHSDMKDSINFSTVTPLASAFFADSPTGSVLPRISDNTFREICKYHGNMVRQFPKKERSPKDQDRRNKNTIACRMSRRVKKLEHIAVEEHYKEFTVQHSQIVEESMRATAYFNCLTQLVKVTDNSRASKLPTSFAFTTSHPASTKQFSIDYIMGVE